jgi:hypothetical protein
MYNCGRSSTLRWRYGCFPLENVLPSLRFELIHSLISIFAVHCTASPFRILNVRLDSHQAFSVWTGSSQERDLVCVPKEAAKFVYQIRKVGSQEEVLNCVTNGHPLTFVITYRMIENGRTILALTDNRN